MHFWRFGACWLPLGIILANTSFKVLLYDKNEENIKTVSQGKMPFVEYGAEKLLKKTLKKIIYFKKL